MSDFKPFDRVLVRDSDDAAWVPGFYSHASGRIDVHYTSILNHSYALCAIPAWNFGCRASP